MSEFVTSSDSIRRAHNALATRRRVFTSAFVFLSCLVFLTIGTSSTFLPSSTVSATSRDRTPPTTPTNLRVTSTTTGSVLMAWNPSTDNSGLFTYRLVQNGSNLARTASQNETSLVWTWNLVPGQTYSFFIFAIDGSGNRSPNSNTVTVTIPTNALPLTQPVVTVTEVGVTHISIAWSSTGGRLTLRYLVFKNGVLDRQGTPETTATFYLLEPSTSYTFTIQAKDGANVSPTSVPLTVTTLPRNPNDVTAPSMPAHLREEHYDDREIHLSWDQSTDDFDLQRILRYDVYVNGVLGDIVVGSGQSLVYGVIGNNTIMVVAVDTAGNQSAPAIISVVLP